MSSAILLGALLCLASPVFSQEQAESRESDAITRAALRHLLHEIRDRKPPSGRIVLAREAPRLRTVGGGELVLFDRSMDALERDSSRVAAITRGLDVPVEAKRSVLRCATVGRPCDLQNAARLIVLSEPIVTGGSAKVLARVYMPAIEPHRGREWSEVQINLQKTGESWAVTKTIQGALT